MIEKPEWDYYDSDPEAINSLLAKLPYLKNPNLKVLEPCAGTGKFIERFESDDDSWIDDINQKL